MFYLGFILNKLKQFLTLELIKKTFIFVFFMALSACEFVEGLNESLSSDRDLEKTEYVSASEYDQMMSSGLLMIDGVSEELTKEGMSLSDVEKFKLETKTELNKQATALCVDVNLASESSSKEINPFSSAAEVVLKATGEIYSAKLAEVKTAEEIQKGIKSLIIKTSETLKAIQTTASRAGYGERYFSDTIAQISGDSLALLESLGIENADVDSIITDVCSGIIQAVGDDLLSSRETLVKKVMSGVVMGARKKSSPLDSDQTIEIAMNISNAHLETEFDAEVEKDFESVCGTIVGTATEAFDDSIGYAMDVLVEVAIVKYKKPDDQIVSLITGIDGKYEDNGVDIPSDIDTIFDPFKILVRLVSENKLESDRAENLKNLINQQKE